MKAGLIISLGLLIIGSAWAQLPGNLTPEAYTENLKQILSQAPRSTLTQAALPLRLPAGWEIGMVSWVTADKHGNIYLLQRGDKADPVIVVDPKGKLLRSWGKGMFTTPHSIRIDPYGNVWTADARTSVVIKYSPEGKKLLEIAVGGVPNNCPNAFCGTTDVAFGPDGHVFIADGYRNARIIEYTANGQKIQEWGSAGTGPGEFRIPHAIVVDSEGIIYVADRENARVQRFDLKGKYLGEWSQYGKIFSMTLSGGAVWLGSRPVLGPADSPGWLIKVDTESGKILEYKEGVVGIHGIHATAEGELLVSPGPAMNPQLFRQHP